MEDQRISVETRRVELVLGDGSRLVGDTFLQLHGMHLTGLQRVGEVLNAEDDFLPLRSGDGVELVNLRQVVAVEVAAVDEFDPLLGLGKEHRIQVTPTVGEPRDVRIFVNLPGGHNRVKDFLNQRDRFLLFLDGDRVLYLARNCILRVKD